MIDKEHYIHAEILEHKAFEQFKEAMNLDCVTRGALMPDAHPGYVLPIGAVVETKNKIFPSFVGYDIGCGVAATIINVRPEEINLEQLRDDILKTIPLGGHVFKNDQEDIYILMRNLKQPGRIGQQFQVITNRSIGTLGSGNHFIELGVSQKTNQVTITIHSGSRTLGGHVAEYYIKEAYLITCENYINNKSKIPDTELMALVDKITKKFEIKNKSWKDRNPDGYEKNLKVTIHKELLKKKGIKSQGLFGLDLNSKLGYEYVIDMEYCLSVATANRQVMIDRIINLISKQLNRDINKQFTVNKNHNHAIINNDLVIHRKGATSADEHEFGIIPGDWSTGCFLILGKGNSKYLNSSSHGAGRIISRKDALETLSIKELELSTVNIINNHTKEHLDEVPKVYKNIYDVMNEQKDSVEIIDHFKPILNIKG